ncbi:cytochrome P450 [Kitasatospora cystarginea]|uniref:Cytochrome P450 n=1 Tax=Kitasatospora cystarginea TaxID=58350 RepID=A0ABN3EWZ1_9ACTN
MAEPFPYPFPRPTALGIPEQIAGVHDDPLLPVVLPSGDEAVLLTRYRDVRQVLTDDRLSRNLSRPDAARISRNNSMFQDPRINPDPPEHTRVRSLVAKAFTATRVKKLEPQIHAIADELIDDMERTGGPVDLNEALAFPLPVRVICRLLGVPDEDVALFRHWTATFLSVSQFPAEEIKKSMADMSRYIAAHIEARRQDPGGDLVSAMIRAHDEEGRLSEYELQWWCRLLLLVGYETTATQLGGGVAMLLSHPDQLSLLREDPSLLPSAIEELLRWKIVGSSVSMLRYATDDIELENCTIKKGMSVIPAADCANQDPGQFPDPLSFDITRSENAHLTFSLGPHFCIGAALARAELRIATEALLNRFPTLRLAVPATDLKRIEGALLEGFTAIPVTW